MGMTGLAVASLAMTAVSTGYSMYSAHQEGKYQQQLYNEQAKLERMKGELALLQSKEQAAETVTEEHRTRAKQIVQAAGAGVDVGAGGTLWDLLAETSMKATKEREAIIRAGKLGLASSEVNASFMNEAGSHAHKTAHAQMGATLFDGMSKALTTVSKTGWFDDGPSSSSPKVNNTINTQPGDKTRMLKQIR